MARVKTYSNDPTLTDSDKLLGTDADGGNITANITLGDLKDFVNDGVDITEDTPPRFLTVVNDDGSDAENSNIAIDKRQHVNDIQFLNQAPEPGAEGTNRPEIQTVTFTEGFSGPYEFSITPASGHTIDISNTTNITHSASDIASELVSQWEGDVDFQQGWVASIGDNFEDVVFTQEQDGNVSGMFAYAADTTPAVHEQWSLGINSGTDRALSITITDPTGSPYAVTTNNDALLTTNAIAAEIVNDLSGVIITDDWDIAIDDNNPSQVNFTAVNAGPIDGDFSYSVAPIAAIAEVVTIEFANSVDTPWAFTITTPGGVSVTANAVDDGSADNPGQLGSILDSFWVFAADQDDWSIIGTDDGVRLTRDIAESVTGSFTYESGAVAGVLEQQTFTVTDGVVAEAWSITVTSPDGTDLLTITEAAETLSALQVRNQIVTAFNALDDDEGWIASTGDDNAVVFTQSAFGPVDDLFEVTVTGIEVGTVSELRAGVTQINAPDPNDVTITVVTQGDDATQSGPPVSDVEFTLEREGLNLVTNAPADDTVNVVITQEGEGTGIAASTDEEFGQGQFILYNNGNGWWFEVHDYSGRFFLPSFVGKNFSAVSGTSPEITVTGTIGEIVPVNGKTYYLDEDGDYAIRFELERTGTITETWDVLPGAVNIAHEVNILSADNSGETLISLSVTFNSDVELSQDLVLNNLTVNGQSQFHDTINIGTEDGDDPVDIYHHGTYHITRENDGIVFGDPPRVALTFDGENISFDGPGDIDIRNDLTLSSENGVDIEPGPVRVTDDDGQRATLSSEGIVITNVDGDIISEIEEVVANDQTQVNNGTLSALRIGERYWTIPSAANSVAELLPGVNETLAPPSGAVDIGNFFYGSELGAQTILHSITTFDAGDISLDPDTDTVPTQFTLADVGTRRSDFQDLRDNRPTGNQIFFIDEDNNTDLAAFSEDDIISGFAVYEVIAYDEDSGLVTFGTLGAGELNIGTGEVRLTGIPNNTAEDSEEFVLIDTADSTLHSRTFANTGFVSSISYEDSNSATQIVSGIEFLGNHNIDLSTPARPQVDISGRYRATTSGIPNIITETTNARAFNVYALDTIAFPRTLTLPFGEIGDSIKIANVSTRNADGDIVDSAVWSISPQTGQLIVKEAESLVLDDPTENFELIYMGGTVGWIII